MPPPPLLPPTERPGGERGEKAREQGVSKQPRASADGRDFSHQSFSQQGQEDAARQKPHSCVELRPRQTRRKPREPETREYVGARLKNSFLPPALFRAHILHRGLARMMISLVVVAIVVAVADGLRLGPRQTVGSMTMNAKKKVRCCPAQGSSFALAGCQRFVSPPPPCNLSSPPPTTPRRLSSLVWAA